MQTVFRVCALASIALTLVGCTDRSDRSSLPTSPSPASPAPPAAPVPGPTGPVTIQIVSGADLRAVVGARMSVGGYQGITDTAGRFDVEAADGLSTPIDVDADGFLPRRTSLRAGVLVSMWPVADEIEADAVRAMVYGGSPQAADILRPYDRESPFYVTLLGSSIGQPPEWGAEATAFGNAIGVNFVVSGSFMYEINEIALIFANGPQCQPPAWGFCPEPSAYRMLRVRPELNKDPGTIRRVLASFFIRANPLAGLMNAAAPDDELSALELQTIRMILQRTLPTRWPDTDR